MAAGGERGGCPPAEGPGTFWKAAREAGAAPASRHAPQGQRSRGAGGKLVSCPRSAKALKHVLQRLASSESAAFTPHLPLQRVKLVVSSQEK